MTRLFDLAPLRRSRVGPPAAKAILAAGGLWLFIQLLFGRVPLLGIGRMDAPVPPGIFVLGAVIGSLYALVAMGIILVYRANRIVNFAQAALGSVPAVFGLVLMSRKGLPYLVALPLVLLGAVLLGGAVETTFIRRFAKAPRLILTVATLGVAQILAFVEFFIPRWVSGDALPPSSFPTPFANLHFNVGIVRFSGDAIVTVVVVAAIVVALNAFFRYTDMGIAVRASAENADRASLLGIPVRRVSTTVWVLAAVLSAIGIFLRAPLVGLPLGGLIGPAVLLFGLAAAVLGRMERLGVAFAGGMALGVIDQSAVFATRRPIIAYGVILFVVLGALLLQRADLARAFDTGISSFQSVRELRPVPPELRHLPEVQALRTVVAVVVGAVALAGPYLFGAERRGLATLVVIYAIVGVSLVVLTGWTGQISLGQFALAGVGAAVAGGLATKVGLDFFLTIGAAGLAGAVVAVLVGVPALRIQGLLLAVTTLAFSFTVENLVLNREFFGWLLPARDEFVPRPVLYGRFDVASETGFYYVALAFLVLVVALAAALRRNRSGRILIGVRENGRVMQAFGVNLARSRLTGFAVSGFFAAIAGALLAYQQGSVDAATYSPNVSITIFVMTVIGGVNSLAGALLGAVYVVGVPELPILNDIAAVEILSTGVGLLFLLLFLPGGLVEGVYRVRDALLRKIADRNGVHVPSLVADSRTPVAPAVEPHVPTGAQVAAAEIAAAVVVCPACGDALALPAVPDHEHFKPAAVQETAR